MENKTSKNRGNVLDFFSNLTDNNSLNQIEGNGSTILQNKKLVNDFFEKFKEQEGENDSPRPN